MKRSGAQTPASDKKIVPASSSIEFSDEDRKILVALRHIREASGTVFSRDLYETLGLSTAPPTADRDDDVLDLLNSWFRTPIVLVEGTGSRHMAGMVELVTDTRFRVFVDLLTGFSEQRAPRLHPISVEVNATSLTMTDVSFSHPRLAAPGGPADIAREQWMAVLTARYTEITTTVESRTSLTAPKHWIARSRLNLDDNAIEIDVSDCYLENFRATDVLSLYDGPSDAVRIRILGSNAVFGGDIADFGESVFDIVDLEWAVFSATRVSFDRAVFACKAEGDESLRQQVINLRDATFCVSADSVSFDDIRVVGDTHEIAFEDAVFRGARVTFARAELGAAAIDCYQSQFLDGASLEFVET